MLYINLKKDFVLWYKVLKSIMTENIQQYKIKSMKNLWVTHFEQDMSCKIVCAEYLNLAYKNVVAMLCNCFTCFVTLYWSVYLSRSFIFTALS